MVKIIFKNKNIEWNISHYSRTALRLDSAQFIRFAILSYYHDFYTGVKQVTNCKSTNLLPITFNIISVGYTFENVSKALEDDS